MSWTRSPAVLLLLTGSLLGLTFPLGKLASLAAVSPVVWAWMVSFGAGACLLLARLASGRALALDAVHLRYYLVSGLVSLVWILAGLCIPLCLAVGNLYRTIAWPAHAIPMELAIGSNLAAALVLLAVLLATGGLPDLARLSTVPWLGAAQVVASAAMASLFFRLQQVGGPTYLSQIGYVGAGVALFAGTVLLDERYGWSTWAGAAVIVAGIALSVLAERQRMADAVS